MTWTVNQVMYNQEAQKEFAKLYKATFGKDVNCNTCPANLYKDYFKLKKHLSLTPNEQIMENTKNFVLKTGALISYKGGVYSEKHLPEAVAIDMLTTNRAFYERKFKSINENMLKEVKETAIEEVVVEAVVEDVEVAKIVETEEVVVPKKRGRKKAE